MIEKVKAGLRGLTPSAKVTHGGAIYNSMVGNAHFPNPEPPLAVVKAAIDELRQANTEAFDRGRMACARKRFAVKAFDKVLSRLAAYVNSVSQGDPAKLSSSGFSLAKRPEPISSLDGPSVMHSVHTPFTGTVALRWSRVPGAVMYEVEMARSGPDELVWKRVGQTTRPQFSVAELEPASTYCFRVTAIGTRTRSAYGPTIGVRAAA